MQMIGFLALAFLCLQATAQPCPKYYASLKMGNQFLQTGNYDSALVQYQVAQVAARECGLNTFEPGLQLKKVFLGLKKQKEEAVRQQLIATAATKEANVQRAIAYAKTKEVIRQQEANQNQLARFYWNNSQRARMENQLLESLHYAVEAASVCKDDELRTNILIDVEGQLPQFAMSKMLLSRGKMRTVLFSPDGKKYMTADNRLWDVATERKTGEIGKPGTQLWPISFSTDGRKLLLRSKVAVYLWDVENGVQIGADMTHEETGYTVLSPGEKMIATTGSDNTLRLWNATTAAPVQSMKHASRIIGLFFNPDGTVVFTITNDSSGRFWHAGSGLPLGSELKFAFGSEERAKGMHGAVFSPDGKFLLTAGSDTAARLWNVASQKQIGTNMTHDGTEVNTAVFSGDSQWVLTTGGNGTVKLWSFTSDSVSLYTTLDAKDGLALPRSWNGLGVGSAVFSADSKWMLIATEVYTENLRKRFTDDTAFLLLEMQQAYPHAPYTFKAAHITEKDDQFVNLARFSPDGRKLFTTETDGRGFIRDLATGHLANPPFMAEDRITSVAFHDNGKQIRTESADSLVQFWQAGNKKEPDFIILKNTRMSVRNAVYSPDASKILTVSMQTSAQLWNASTANAIGPPLEHKGEIRSAAFSSDGKSVVTTGADSTVRIWNTETGQPKGKPLVFHEALSAAVFSKNGKNLVIADSRGSIYLYNFVTSDTVQYKNIAKTSADALIVRTVGKQLLATGLFFNDRAYETVLGKQVADEIRQKRWGRRTAFSPAGNQFAFVHSHNSALLSDARGDNVAFRELMHEQEINGLCFSPDGKRVLTASNDSTARLWDATTGRQVGPAMKHHKAVIAAAFSANGNRIITAGIDNTVRLWEAATAKQLSVFPVKFWQDDKQESFYGSITYSPDESHIITVDADVQTRIWTIPGDLDMPPALLKLQIQTATGVQLNTATGEVEVLSREAWQKLNNEYRQRGKEHFRNCRYRDYNFWSRFYADSQGDNVVGK